MALTATAAVVTAVDANAVIKSILDELQLLKHYLVTPTVGAQAVHGNAITVAGLSANAIVISAHKIKDNTVVTGALKTVITSDVVCGAGTATCTATDFDANEQLELLVWNKA